MVEDSLRTMRPVNGTDVVPLPGRRRRPLGELLLGEGVISAEQLALALEIQRSTGKRLGRVLSDMGAVGQEQLARVLSQQMGMEFIRLTGASVREDLARLLPAAVARRLQVIPVSDQDGTLTVAMVDPLDVVALDDIRRLVAMPRPPLLARSARRPVRWRRKQTQAPPRARTRPSVRECAISC